MATFAHLQDHNRGVYQDVRRKCHGMDAFQNKSHEARRLLKIKARLRLCIFQNKSLIVAFNQSTTWPINLFNSRKHFIFAQYFYIGALP